MRHICDVCYSAATARDNLKLEVYELRQAIKALEARREELVEEVAALESGGRRAIRRFLMKVLQEIDDEEKDRE